LANPTDRSDLPAAELNPLMNPLLAKNMGRWAEVYFNAVPEKREEAVQQLVRELEAEESGANSDATRESDRNRLGRENSFLDAAAQQPHIQPERHVESGALLVCPACGHENAIGQKFCGMCGAPLQTERLDDYASQPRHEDSFRAAYSNIYGRREHTDDDPNLDHMFELQPSYSNSYRIFIAGAVAIIAVVLVFVAWRSGEVASAIMRLRGEAPAPAQQQLPADQSQNPTPPQSATTQESGAASSAEPAQPEPRASSQPPQQGHPEEASVPKSPANESAAADRQLATPQTVAAPDNGAQELATAHQFLNTGNRAEAAQWLWRSVAKRNLDATVELSDLYMKGEGVAKSCDQARILLDAAALRGSKEAGIRLRNPQAFGCQ
jgi:hypothetical protein